MTAEIAVEKPAYPIASVASALRLLLMVGNGGPLRLAKASEELGTARSTAHRLLQMLQYYGFVSQDPDSKAYSIGPALVDIGLQAVRELDVRTFARPYIEALAEDVQETVHLLEFQPDGKMFCLDSVESPKTLRVGGRTGMKLPAFASASGRAVLSTMPESQILDLYPNARLPKLHETTITKRSELLEEVRVAAKHGYAVQSGESEPGISGIAAPIKNSDGRARFSLTVAVPSSRLRDGDVPRIAATVISTAEAIGGRLPS